MEIMFEDGRHVGEHAPSSRLTSSFGSGMTPASTRG